MLTPKLKLQFATLVGVAMILCTAALSQSAKNPKKKQDGPTDSPVVVNDTTSILEKGKNPGLLISHHGGNKIQTKNGLFFVQESGGKATCLTPAGKKRILLVSPWSVTLPDAVVIKDEDGSNNTIVDINIPNGSNGIDTSQANSAGDISDSNTKGAAVLLNGGTTATPIPAVAAGKIRFQIHYCLDAKCTDVNGVNQCK